MLDFLASNSLEYNLKVPQDPLTIILWILWLGVLIFLAFKYRVQGSKFDKVKLFWLAGLSLSVLILTPFFGIPLDNLALEGFPHAFMFFAALPWLIAGGVMGTLPAALVAGMSGLLTAYLDTHSIFTPLVYITAALFFCLCTRQRYRTFTYRLIRFPLVAAFVSSLLTLPFLFLALMLSGSEELTVRAAVVMEGFGEVSLYFVGMMSIGGLAGVFAKLAAKKSWGSQAPLQPSPGEVSLKSRWMGISLPLTIILMVVLVLGCWTAAENNARRSMVEYLTSTADEASKTLTVFIDTGEQLILNASGDEMLMTAEPGALHEKLEQELNSLPFFSRMAVMTTDGKLVTAYPSGTLTDLAPTGYENAAIQSAENDVVSVVPASKSDLEGRTARVSFFTKVDDPSGQTNRVLWGQADISPNPYFQPINGVLEDMEVEGVNVQVVGKSGHFLYQTNPQRESEIYQGVSYSTATFFEEISSDGQVSMQFYQPVGENGWAVVTAYPVRSLQVAAWGAISPFMWISLFAILILNAVMMINMASLDKEIRQLNDAADKLTHGDYHVDFSSRRPAGAVRNLQWSFQRMTQSLQEKERKQTDLLSLTERITGQLSLKDSLQIVLMAALERGVSSARIVLMDTLEKDTSDTPGFQFGLGEYARRLSLLDREILALTRSQGVFIFRDSQIQKLLGLQRGMPIPASLIAVPLKWKDSRLGALWVTYKDQRNPGSVEMEFFMDLSKKAASAIINARAFDKSITSKNQLETVLDVLIDPVMISDDFDRIIYMNKSAQTLIRQVNEGKLESSLSSAFPNKGLLALLREARQGTRSKELKLKDSRIYHITANPVQIDDKQMGLAVLFKDITEYRSRESQKTELVTTTSHELRAPLTLVQGYAKILRLTGNLNAQQSGYVDNIIEGVEEMKSLVQNLLDLDRLESAHTLKTVQVDAGNLVRQVVDGFAAQSRRKNLHIGVSIPDVPITLEADRSYLTQALKNLVENAVKFSKMGGSVNVSLMQDGKSAVFSVQDSGIGIAPLDQQHLFEKFYRTSTPADEELKGSGLGLAIVKSIVEHHLGKVWVESKLGKGSTFYIRIPLKWGSSLD